MKITKKMLGDAGFPDTPTARAILSRMLDEDDDIQVYQRSWVGLTEEEKELIVGMFCKKDSSHDDAERVAKAIEAKLKEKNT